jgi:hypothetical protein
MYLYSVRVYPVNDCVAEYRMMSMITGKTAATSDVSASQLKILSAETTLIMTPRSLELHNNVEQF